MSRKVYLVLDEDFNDGYAIAHHVGFDSRIEAQKFLRRLRDHEGKGWLMIKEIEILPVAPEPTVWHRAIAAKDSNEVNTYEPFELVFWDHENTEPDTDPCITRLADDELWVESRDPDIATRVLNEEVERVWGAPTDDSASASEIEYRKMAAGFHAQFGHLFMDGKDK